MAYDRKKIDEFMAQVKRLDSFNRKVLYALITESHTISEININSPIDALMKKFDLLSAWEQANAVFAFGEHMAKLMNADFRYFVELAREDDKNRIGTDIPVKGK